MQIHASLARRKRSHETLLTHHDDINAFQSCTDDSKKTCGEYRGRRHLLVELQARLPEHRYWYRKKENVGRDIEDKRNPNDWLRDGRLAGIAWVGRDLPVVPVGPACQKDCHHNSHERCRDQDHCNVYTLLVRPEAILFAAVSIRKWSWEAGIHTVSR